MGTICKIHIRLAEILRSTPCQYLKSYFGWSILRVGEINQAYCENRPVSTQFNRYGAKDSQNICQYRSEERKERSNIHIE